MVEETVFILFQIEQTEALVEHDHRNETAD